MKKVMLISSVLLTIIIGVYFYCRLDSDKYVLESRSSNQKVSTNALTMMYETEANSGEYVVSSDTSWPQEGYVFNANLSSCENGSTLTWDDENKRILMQANKSDKCYVYFDVYVERTLADVCANGNNLNDCIQKYYATYGEGTGGLYYHDGVGSYASLEAGDNSYRYSGANPNNYVCFGSDAEECPYDNLYRIIGTFDISGQYYTKLIKADFIHDGMMTFDYVVDIADSDVVHTHDISDMKTYKGQLLEIDAFRMQFVVTQEEWDNYYAETGFDKPPLFDVSPTGYFILDPFESLFESFEINFSEQYLNLLFDNEWPFRYGGVRFDNSLSQKNNIPKIVTEYENKYRNANYNHSTKFGLMFISDYGFAASPENWNTTMNNYNNDTNRNNNWMYMGLNEWTLIDNIDEANIYIFFRDTGAWAMVAENGSVMIADGFGMHLSARPCLYLNANVIYNRGTGTISDSIRLSI